ncbi:MAG: helix-turn-helix domain-containing protein [Planctomycetia bacterium]|nr:helix-turn-helix domain-containing protein [Planctomycetia bacterium]
MRHADGQFELQNWQSLWGMLTVMTIRRCSERIKHFHAARRNVNREVTAPVSDESRSDWQPSDLEPTPAESAALTEIVQDVVHDLEPDDRPILVLHLQGRSVAEISQEINRTRRAVQRVLQRLRLRLERMCLADMDSV